MPRTRRDYESVKQPTKYTIKLSVAYQRAPPVKSGVRKPMPVDRQTITIDYIREPYYATRYDKPASVMAVRNWPAHWGASQIPNVKRAFRRATGLYALYLEELVRDGLDA